MSQDDRTTGGEERNVKDELSRRTFLRLGAVAGAAAPLAGLLGADAEAAQVAAEVEPLSAKAIAIEGATIAQLQAAMTRGGLTSLNLVDFYLDRINRFDQRGPKVRRARQNEA